MANQAKTSRQLTGLVKLVKLGMKMLVARPEKLSGHDRRFDTIEGKLDQIIDQTAGKRTNGRRRSWHLPSRVTGANVYT